eukprot:gene16027-biopygen6722
MPDHVRPATNTGWPAPAKPGSPAPLPNASKAPVPRRARGRRAAAWSTTYYCTGAGSYHAVSYPVSLPALTRPLAARRPVHHEPAGQCP